MKIHHLDAHDRFTHFKKQDFDIAECCQNLINQRPFGDVPFYIYAHPRTDEDGTTKRLIWQPRLTKPKAQTNSMLFKGYPGTDLIKIIWIIPPRELWEQFGKGKLTENEMIYGCIQDFLYNRSELEAPEADDLTDGEICRIYEEISAEANRKKNDGRTSIT